MTDTVNLTITTPFASDLGEVLRAYRNALRDAPAHVPGDRSSRYNAWKAVRDMAAWSIALDATTGRYCPEDVDLWQKVNNRMVALAYPRTMVTS